MRTHLIDDDEGLTRVLREAKTVAVLGAKPAPNEPAHYVPAYWHPYYQALGYRRGLCPRAEDAYARILTLPLFPAMTDHDVEDVVTALRKVLAYYAQ